MYHVGQKLFETTNRMIQSVGYSLTQEAQSVFPALEDFTCGIVGAPPSGPQWSTADLTSVSHRARGCVARSDVSPKDRLFGRHWWGDFEGKTWSKAMV